MKFVYYSENNHDYILPICNSCLSGEHLSYGYDHTLGSLGRRDCKVIDEKRNQWMCNSDWPELFDKIKNKSLENVFNDNKKAEEFLNKLKEGK